MKIATLAQAMDRIGELETEIAYLRDVLGIVQTASHLTTLRRQWGLTKTEARVVLALYRRSPGALTKDALLSILYSERPNDEPIGNVISVYICKIRAKFPEHWVCTSWSVGYFLSDDGRSALNLAFVDDDTCQRSAA